jgi:formylglycine-generating enzyme required for sulfatase activity
MIWITGGTFRMGSDTHYAEEAPVHRATVGGFWIDRTPVPNREFRKFVRATFAEIAPNSEDYPGALSHMLRAGSLVFSPPKHPVDTSDWSQWWTLQARRQLEAALIRRQAGIKARQLGGSCHNGKLSTIVVLATAAANPDHSAGCRAVE